VEEMLLPILGYVTFSYGFKIGFEFLNMLTVTNNQCSCATLIPLNIRQQTSNYQQFQRMGGAVPPLPQYAFMAWCSVRGSTGTTYTYSQEIRHPNIRV
jgi:hypothetical protein